MKVKRAWVQVKLFWRDVFIAGAQVTFGIFAAAWFVSPFDARKITVLVINAALTIMFIFAGLYFSKRL